jgi:hypothetical protein
LTSSKIVEVKGTSSKVSAFKVINDQDNSGSLDSDVFLNYSSSDGVSLVNGSCKVRLTFDGVVKKSENITISTSASSPIKLVSMTVSEEEILGWDDKMYQNHQLSYEISANVTFNALWQGGKLNSSKTLSHVEEIELTLTRDSVYTEKITPLEDTILKMSDSRLIDGMDSGWSATVGSIFFDSSDYVTASGSLKGTPSGTNEGHLAFQKSFSGHPIDLKECNLGFYIKTSGDMPSDFTFHLEVYDTSSRVRVWSYYNTGSRLSGSDEIWSHHFVGSTDFDYATTIDMTKINRVVFKFDSATSGNWTFSVDELRAFPVQKLFPNGAVILTFDGPYAHQYDWAEVKMDEYGYSGVIATAQLNIQARTTLKDHLKVLYDKGWDICVYGRLFDYQDPPQHLEESLILNDTLGAFNDGYVLGEKLWLDKMGFTRSSHFLQCNRHMLDVYTEDILSNYFYFIKGTHWLGSNRVTLPTLAFHGVTHSFEQDLADVERAHENGEIFIWFNHLLDDGEYTEAQYSTLIDKIHELGVEVITYSELLDRYQNYLELRKPVVVNSTITLTRSFDGGGRTYMHGQRLGDFPLFKLVGTDITLSNVVIDDSAYVGLNGAVVIGGFGNSIVNCTLKNCVRYGFTVSEATDFYIGYNTVLQAQYGVSGSSGGGSSGWGINGVIEHNDISGIVNCGVKCKAFRNVVIRNNTIDLTPITSRISPTGVNFSDDAPNVGVVFEDNDVFRSGVGVGGSTYGVYVDRGPNIADRKIISTGNIIRGNRFSNCTQGAYLVGNSVGSSSSIDFTVVDNVFTNCGTAGQVIVNYGVNNVIKDNVLDGVLLD